jgi:hypothetical protein
VLFTTITTADEKTSYRNLLTTMNHGNRHSIMDANGNDLIQEFQKNYPAGPTRAGLVLADLDAANSAANVYSPLAASYAVTQDAIEDGSFLRLQNLTLGFTFPKAWTQKFACNQLRLYCTLNNVFCITKYTGYDPEVNSAIRGSKTSGLTPGADFSAYPKSFSWTVGANITF